MTRQQKTPRQRAQEQLDVAKRVTEKLVRQRDAARTELDRLQTEADAAIARRDYLAQHPDLQDTSTTPSTSRNQSGDTA